MLAGLHLSNVASRPKLLSALFFGMSWRMPAGVHGLAGSNLAFRAEPFGKLSSPIVASVDGLRRMQEVLH